MPSIRRRAVDSSFSVTGFHEANDRKRKKKKKANEVDEKGGVLGSSTKFRVFRIRERINEKMSKFIPHNYAEEYSFDFRSNVCSRSSA